MEIRVWNSYSCNNSSSFYLVAHFESEKLTANVAKELETFLAAHAEEKDELDDWEATTKAQADIGKKYGFDFKGYLAGATRPSRAPNQAWAIVANRWWCTTPTAADFTV